MSDSLRPTVLVDQYRKTSTAEGNENSYRGLQIHALPGLHGFLMDVLLKAAPGGSRVLDLAAGTGAMSLRMKDQGYEVTATDYVTENFRLHGDVPFVTGDLNGDALVMPDSKFDVIMASEIIEHLENPRHFARLCGGLLRPGGVVIVSSPNIDSTSSILLNLQTGRHAWFSEFNYRVDGHITPMGQWQIGKCFGEAGFDSTWQGSFGDSMADLNGSPRMKVLCKILDRLRSLPVSQRGAIYCAVFTKT
jgi:SAM-dependent methyltransferase